MRNLILLAASLFTIAQIAVAQETLRPVKTMTIAEPNGVLERQFFGNVVARQTVDLAFQVSGQIKEFPVLEGSPVLEGQLIAELDLEPFELSLAQTTVQKEQADRDSDRLERLSSSTVSQANKDDAKAAADLAAIAVRNAEFALEQATLSAPFNGLIASRNVANFTTVQAGSPIVRLHDVSEWRVEIDVPEVLFRRASEDNEVAVYGMFSGSDRRIPLELREFRAEASQVGQTFKITLAMLEEPGPGVLPGSTITVVAGLNVPDRGMLIPASAVAIADNGTTSVMVFVPGEGDKGTVSRVNVDLSTGTNGEFLVKSGLNPGDEIVVAGANQLTDGQETRRFAGFSN
ncbi:MAG: efflux RND transporter periplasmic adaptor subunit [Boseongicola sp.]|nr:MAG: efflux RND transporter periplasmic adaptor subunit [Boseongicola sp.]